MNVFRKISGFVLVVVGVIAFIPPSYFVFPSIGEWIIGRYDLWLSHEAWDTLIMLAWVSGAGLVGGIWMIKASS